jgi:hypothetical protein
VLLSLGIAASALSNFSAAFVFVAQSLAFFRRAGVSHRSMARWGGVTALVLVLIAPWIYRVTTYVDFGKLATPVLPGELDPGERLRGETTFRVESIPYAAYAYSAGLSLGPSLRELHDNPALAPVVERHAPVIVWVTALFGCVLVLGVHTALRRAGPGVTLEVVSYTLVPLAATLLLNWQNAKAFNVRYVIVGLPAYLALLAVGLAGMGRWRGWIVGGLLMATCAVSVGNDYFSPRYAREDVKRAVAEMDRRMTPGDCIFAPTVWQVVQHYRRDDAPLYSVYADAPAASRAQMDALLGTCPTFWYVRARAWVDDPDGYVAAEIERRCDVLDRFERPGVVVTRYGVKDPGAAR